MRPTLAVLLCSLAACDPDPFGEDGGYPFPPGSDAGYRERCLGGGASGISGVGPDGGCESDGAVPAVDAGPPPPPCNEHTFRYEGAASSVWVSGTFNGWAETPEAGAIALDEEPAGVWSATVLVEPPGRHEYKLVLDGGATWIPDPTVPERVDDGFGGQNSVLFLCGSSCGDPAEYDWRDAVMYFVMVDRFRDSDGRADPVPGASEGDARTGASAQYEGGDLRGVTERLDYLADLGVTAVWLSAPMDNREASGASVDPAADPHRYSGYHGYWPSPADIDYGAPGSPRPRPRVEPRIGSEADLRALVDGAHATTGADGHGMKVLFDYVMNHVDADSALAIAHPDWFARRDGRIVPCEPEDLWNDPYWGTRCAFTDYLPPFDFDVVEARRWSVNDAVWWAREFGVDGLRLDAIRHVSTTWLTDLRARLSAEIADPAGGRFYLVGETFAYDDAPLIASYVDPETRLDGQFDFPLKARLCEAVFTPDGGLDGLAAFMQGNDGYYGAGAVMTTWIGNHDVPRAIHFASRQIGDCRAGSHPGNSWTSSFPQPTDAAPYERLAVAFAILMTSPGIPLVYYGDEIGLAGGGDPDNRRTMPWDDGSLNAHQRALRGRVRALARARGQHRVLSRGARTTLSVDRDTWVYRMSGCDAGAVVAINRADAERSVDVPAGEYLDLLAGGDASGGARTLPPRGYAVLLER